MSLITALAATLRFSTLGVQEFWLDEQFTVALVDLDLSQMLEQIPKSESNPPFYYIVARLWTDVFGTGEAGVRSLSALFGTVTVPIVYAAARELCDRRTAFAASGLAAVSPFLVWYSQEARAYALLVLLGALSLWLLARLLRRWSAREAALWALVSALALATHYFALFLILPQALWLLGGSGRRLGALLAVGAVGVAGAALLPLATSQAGLGDYIADESLAKRVGAAAKQLALGYDSPLEPVTAAFAVAVALAGIGLALGSATRAQRGVWVAATIAGGCIGLPLVLAVLGTDYVLARNMIIAWVPLTILVAAGLTARRAGRIGPAVLAAVCLLGLVSTIGVPLKPEWQRGDRQDWSAARPKSPYWFASASVRESENSSSVSPCLAPLGRYCAKAGIAQWSTATQSANEVALTSPDLAISRLGVTSVGVVRGE